MSDSSPPVDFDDIRDDGEPEVADQEPGVDPETLAARPPGPGLPESVGWTIGTWIFLQIVGVFWIVLVAVYLASQDPNALRGGPEAVLAAIEDLPANGLILAFLPPSFFAFLLIIPVGLLRLGRQPLRKLNFSAPSLTQLVLILAVVLPASIVSSALFVPAEAAWNAFCEGKPLLEMINEEINTMDMIGGMEGGSLILLLFFLAIVPAVGEEFVFRGVIGRGMTARWGVGIGVAVTSILFAVMHTYPPHIVAVLPLGMLMHVLYLTTRSFWAPILLHFANNGLASLMLSFGVEDPEFGLPVLAAAMTLLVVTIALLYRYRTRYVDQDGLELDPGYVSMEAPPPDSEFKRTAPFSWVVVAVFGTVFFATVLYLGKEVVTHVNNPPDEQAVESDEDAVEFLPE